MAGIEPPIWSTMDTRPIRRRGHYERYERRNYQWEKTKVKFRDYCRRSNALCHLCIRRGDFENAAIDYAAKPQSPKAFEPDHIKPWRTHPHLRYEWANLAASHSICNRQRRDEVLEVAAPQQDWVKPDW